MAQVAFHGNVGKVKQAQFGNDGKCRITFSVAEGHQRFNKQTNVWDETGTTWRRVTVFGKRAETLADVLREGAKQQVVVIGREETRAWQKDDGSSGESLEVVADVVGLIPTSNQQTNAAFTQSQPAPAADPWAAQAPAANTWGNGNTNTEPPF